MEFWQSLGQTSIFHGVVCFDRRTYYRKWWNLLIPFTILIFSLENNPSDDDDRRRRRIFCFETYMRINSQAYCTMVPQLCQCVAISIHKIHEVSMHHHHSMHKRFQLAIRCSVIRILEISVSYLHLLRPHWAITKIYSH